VKGETGARGTFTYEKDGKFTGIKAQFQVTIAADRTIAPICIYLTGLTEEKLSCSKCPGGILEIPIQGLTYSGAIDPRDKLVGYVICLRGCNCFFNVHGRCIGALDT
jgi:hypothetical protein